MKSFIVTIILLSSVFVMVNCNDIANNSNLQMLNNAIDRQDTAKIRRILVSNPMLINNVDSDYDNIPLIRAVDRRKRASVEQLLRLGADPNIISKRGMTPLIKAIDFGRYDVSFNEDPTFVEILLKAGADPNLNYVVPDDSTGHTILKNNESPLMYSVGGYGYEKSLLLIHYGADIHYKLETQVNAAILSLILEDIDNAYNLIVNLNADITQPYYYYKLGSNDINFDDPREPVDLLFFLIYEIGTPEFKKKMAIVEKLESNGIYYHSRKDKIPESVLYRIKQLHPSDFSEYIEVY